MRLLNRLILFILASNIALSGMTQAHYDFKNYNFAVSAKVIPRQVNQDWLFELQNLEAPFQGNTTYKYYLEQIKRQVEAKYDSKGFISSGVDQLPDYSVDTPIVTYAFEGNAYSSSVPNDNTMAISNDGIVVAAINTNIIFFDTKSDSLLKTISLSAFSDTLANISTHQYDPKAIYDYQHDRFILVYLAGSGTDATSNIIVAFSSSSNPMDEWFLYSLPGNPLLDTSWTDYPAVSLSNNELYITGNLLKKGNGSWQTSFKQSVIWQIDKSVGFSGDSIQLGLYTGIGLNGIPVRNIHPIRGGNQFYGPEMYFLSQRNFDIENDTFFLIKTSDLLGSQINRLDLTAMRSDQKYGVPPNAKQTNNRRLATNDSRVLGGFFQNGLIQFVGNSVDTLTGHASFYHGIFNPLQKEKQIHLNIFTDSILEFGYPNISYCGTTSESKHAMISYNYTADVVFPGMGAMFYENENLYSKPINLKSGETPIYILTGTQRWGDYSGSQPKYNKPGEVWVAATFGKLIGSKRGYGTWISSLKSSVEDIVVIPPGEKIVSNFYPNPLIDQKASLDFVLTQEETISIEIVDMSGKIVAILYEGKAKQGRNVMSFSTISLSNGVYFVIIKNESEVLKSHKISVL